MIVNAGVDHEKNRRMRIMQVRDRSNINLMDS